MTSERSDFAAAVPFLRARMEGQQAARDGEPLTALPYDLRSEDVFERVKARMWLRGYDKVNPANIDYSE